MNPGGRRCSELRLCHCTPVWVTERDGEKRKELKWVGEKVGEMEDGLRRNGISVIEVPEGEKHVDIAELMFKTVIQEMFPKLEKDLNLHVERTDLLPGKMNRERSALRRFLIKLLGFRGEDEIPIICRVKVQVIL